MLPLADDIPNRRAPVLTIFIIAVWVAMWIVHLVRPDDGNISDSSQALDCRWGVVPEHLVHGAGSTTDPCALINADHQGWIEVVTAQFLHASWWHILGNVLFIWVFGASVEARLGRVRFLPFALACGSLALVVQALASSASTNPIIGGSGMVAAVLGAYIVLFPSARVWALVIIIPLRLPAWILLVAWFGYQLVAALGGAETGTAYWAHVAGFAAGAVLIRAASLGLPPPPVPRSAMPAEAAPA